MKNTNLEVPLLPYPSLDFFHCRLVAVRGKLLYVMHFSTKASRSSLLACLSCCQILDGGIDCASVVNDERFKDELKQVFLFMIGILASTSKETAESVIKLMAKNINLIDPNCNEDVCALFHLALGCILECSALSRTLGLRLHISDLDLSRISIYDSGAACLSQVLAANSSLTDLYLRRNNIGDSGATSLSQAFATNSSTSG